MNSHSSRIPRGKSRIKKTMLKLAQSLFLQELDQLKLTLTANSLTFILTPARMKVDLQQEPYSWINEKIISLILFFVYPINLTQKIWMKRNLQWQKFLCMPFRLGFDTQHLQVTGFQYLKYSEKLDISQRFEGFNIIPHFFNPQVPQIFSLKY